MSYTTNNGKSWPVPTNNNSIGYSVYGSNTSNVEDTIVLLAAPGIYACGTYAVSMNAQFANSPNAWIWVCGNSNDTILSTMSWQSSGGNPPDPGGYDNKVIACQSMRNGVAGSAANLSCSSMFILTNIYNSNYAAISFYVFSLTTSNVDYTYTITKIT